MKIACNLLLFLLFPLSSYGYIKQKGEELTIISYQYLESDFFSDNGGQRINGKYNKQQLNIYQDWGGLTDINFFSQLILTQATIQDNKDFDIEEYSLGGRFLLYQGKAEYLTLLPFIKLPSFAVQNEANRVSNSLIELGATAEYNHSFSLNNLYHNFKLTIGYQQSIYDHSNQGFDSSLLKCNIELWLNEDYEKALKLSLYNDFSLSDNYASSKLTISAIFHINHNISLEIGYQKSLYNRNNHNLDGVIISLWRNF